MRTVIANHELLPNGLDLESLGIEARHVVILASSSATKVCCDRRGLRRSLKRMMRTRVPQYLDDLVDEAQKMHPKNFSGNARLLLEWNLDGQSRLYTNPVLVTSGDRDTLVSPSSAEATTRAFPNGAYALLRNVGHSP